MLKIIYNIIAAILRHVYIIPVHNVHARIMDSIFGSWSVPSYDRSWVSAKTDTYSAAVQLYIQLYIYMYISTTIAISRFDRLSVSVAGQYREISRPHKSTSVRTRIPKPTVFFFFRWFMSRRVKNALTPAVVDSFQ